MEQIIDRAGQDYGNQNSTRKQKLINVHFYTKKVLLKIENSINKFAKIWKTDFFFTSNDSLNYTSISNKIQYEVFKFQ